MAVIWRKQRAPSVRSVKQSTGVRDYLQLEWGTIWVTSASFMDEESVWCQGAPKAQNDHRRTAMQRRHALRDDQWERIKDALPGKVEDPGRTSANNRLFIEAVMWIAKTGAPWRDLPSEYGRSRGGFGTKIHALADALGNPMKFILTGGEKSDYHQALPLLSGEVAGAVLADKGYDADYIIEEVIAMEAEPVIPPRSTRKNPRAYDEFLYKERNDVDLVLGSSADWLLFGIEHKVRIVEEQKSDKEGDFTSEGVRPSYNREVLFDVVEAVEDILEELDREMVAEKKAEVVCDLYEMMEEGEVRQSRMKPIRVLKLIKGALAAHE
ncbi:hypothetical protein AAG570_014162 [Ranatra chinensis]|uniref:Insertion element IS402-like domain-containing protein n=1 Tax=Ranatra chinensis TaxID=642074 RepID=A0ABD0XU90_9HEMI